MKTEIRVLISILNWNSSLDTIKCVESVLRLEKAQGLNVVVRVIDNGSSLPDYQSLQSGTAALPVELIRHESNLGFAGGHNASIHAAVHGSFDYIWLLNNDAIVTPSSLSPLVRSMQDNPRCGSCSPVVVRMGNASLVDFCGASHNWVSLGARHPHGLDDAPAFAAAHESSLWCFGTAVLFRVAALQKVGPLDARLFAYYEDDDIGERLIQAGWVNRIVFESTVQHACFEGVITDRKPYYFYLMARNSFIFFLQHTPKANRRLLHLRLIDRSLVVANDLLKKGMSDKANACLLGIADGMAGRHGAPDLNRSVPWWLRVLLPVGRLWNRQ